MMPFQVLALVPGHRKDEDVSPWMCVFDAALFDKSEMLVELERRRIIARHEADYLLHLQLLEWVVEPEPEEFPVEPVLPFGRYVHGDRCAIEMVVQDARHEVPVLLKPDGGA